MKVLTFFRSVLFPKTRSKLCLFFITGSAFYAAWALAFDTVAADELPQINEREFECTIRQEPPGISCRLHAEASSSKTFSAVSELQLDNPPRFVIDLPGLHVKLPQKIAIEHSNVFSRVRTGQHLDSARIVLDLAQNVTFERSKEGTSTNLKYDFKGVQTALVVPQQGQRKESQEKVVEVAEASPTLPLWVTEKSPQVLRATRQFEPIPDSSPSTQAAEPNQKVSVPAPISTLPSASVSPVEVAAYQKPTPSSPDENTLKLSFASQSLQPDRLLKFSVDRNFLSLEAGERPVADLSIVNKTEKPLFLKSSVERILHAGQADESYEQSKELLASPKRFEIPALGQRTLRLVFPGKRQGDAEQVFRVSLYPQEEEFDEAAIGASVNNVPAQISVVAGLGVIVTVPGEGATGQLKTKTEALKLVLENSGTRAVLIEHCSICPLKSKTCSAVPQKILHAGSSWSINSKREGLVVCDARQGKLTQKLSIPLSSLEVR